MIFKKKQDAAVQQTAAGEAKPAAKGGKAAAFFRKNWKWMVPVVCVAVLGGWFILRPDKAQNANTDINYVQVSPSKRDVSNTLSGTGTLNPANTYNVKSLVAGKVLTSSFEEGDIVEEGTVLYTVDSSDATTKAEQASIALQQAQRSYDKTADRQYVRAEVAGVVSALKVAKGDEVTSVQTAQKERITDQWSLEKTVRGEMIGVMKLSIHVPQLVCDSPDAAALNEELAAMYAAEYMDYESDPDAGVPQGEECPQTEINWDAYWYGDCVSLVMFRYDGGSDPGYSRGWCFDFATGQQVSMAEMLQRMGLDPDAVQQQMLREAMQTFDRDMAQGGYYEGLLSGGNLASMRMNTLENNQLDDLCLLLPQPDRLVLRGGCSSPPGVAGGSWMWRSRCRLLTRSRRRC